MGASGVTVENTGTLTVYVGSHRFAPGETVVDKLLQSEAVVVKGHKHLAIKSGKPTPDPQPGDQAEEVVEAPAADPEASEES